MSYVKKQEERVAPDEIDLIKYFSIATRIVERAESGIPQDRWIRGDHEMVAFVKAYVNLSHVVRMMEKERIDAGYKSMSIDNQYT
jgi:hypothetical protein